MFDVGGNLQLECFEVACLIKFTPITLFIFHPDSSLSSLHYPLRNLPVSDMYVFFFYARFPNETFTLVFQ